MPFATVEALGILSEPWPRSWENEFSTAFWLTDVATTPPDSFASGCDRKYLTRSTNPKQAICGQNKHRHMYRFKLKGLGGFPVGAGQQPLARVRPNRSATWYSPTKMSGSPAQAHT